MKSQNLNWNKAGVFICTKCMKGTETAEKLKTEWKMKLKEMGLHKEVRVMTSSCLDVCPEKSQALAVLNKRGEQVAYVFVPESETTQIFDKIVEIAKS